MTTYQIFSALKSGEMKVYLDEVSEEDPAYTAGTGEYWLTAEGKSCEWADGIAFGGLLSTETSLVLEVGHHPDNVSPAPTKIPITKAIKTEISPTAKLMRVPIISWLNTSRP